MSPSLRLVVVAVCSLSIHAAAPTSATRGTPRDVPGAEPRAGSAAPFCGTDRFLATSRARAVEPLPDGTPVSFQQDPPILSPTHTGEVRLRAFRVLGDVTEATFWLYDPEANDYTKETWRRVATTTTAGRLVSVFEPAWPNEAFLKFLRDEIRGFDYPSIYWGSLEMPGTDPPVFTGVRLRLGSTGIPPSPVVRVDETVQYSSHVVNLVVQDFGDTRITGGPKDFDQRRLARRFYELFADEYDSLAIVPAASHLATYTAFHSNVKNDVEGIGMGLFDSSSLYGSSGRLRSVEVYVQADLPTHATSNHEIGHQWGHYIDWERLGLVRYGDSDRAHTPLAYPGETLVGTILEGTRRVRQSSSTTFEIERTQPPIGWHPLELYAMGLIGPQEVPTLLLFEDQAQFKGSLPGPGTAVLGNARVATINDVLGLQGTRRGPVPSTWRRATVVVSRDGLITREEMDYWNFFAARLADPGRSGVMSYDGYTSFDASTGGRIDLQTDIVPREAPPVIATLNVDAPHFGRSDCRGFEFSETIPTRYRVRDEIRVAGRVTATDERFNYMLLRYWKYGGTTRDAVLFYEPVSGPGSFTPRVMFREGEEGSYYLQLYLFWPDAPPQNPRCTISPVVVE